MPALRVIEDLRNDRREIYSGVRIWVLLQLKFWRHEQFEIQTKSLFPLFYRARIVVGVGGIGAVVL